MNYQAELDIVRESFRMLHINTHIIYRDTPLDESIDMGIRKLLGASDNIGQVIGKKLDEANKHTVYIMTDGFACNYMFLILPDDERDCVLLVGPYLSKPITKQQIADRCKGTNISEGLINELEKYYIDIPSLPDDSHLFIMVDAFCAKVWNTDDFAISQLESGTPNLTPILSKGPKKSPSSKDAWNINIIEQRYTYENEIIKAVAKGQTHKIKLLSSFNSYNLEKRTTDSLRNIKNYGVVMNTLLRKAAESGGVHPIHIDSVSSDVAVRIEHATSVAAVQDIMIEMFLTYCRLVKKHSIRQYSPPVQKALTHIESDLSADLSLSTLAAIQGISASYLSNIFKKETGQTVTDYVNSKRMDYASHLLGTTKQQIQTIAQQCGILDVQYFSKLFKKYKGVTPKEHRKSVQNSDDAIISVN